VVQDGVVIPGVQPDVGGMVGGRTVGGGRSRVATRLRRAVVFSLVGALAVSLSAVPAAGHRRPPAAPPPALQEALDRLVADGVPGVIALARRDGDVVHAVSGVRDLTTQDPIRNHDRFRIGSITKSFVATVILQLVGEGRLRLDDTVERWLPGLVPNGAGITVDHLLHHASGLFDYVRDGDTTAVAPYAADDWAHVWAPRELVAISTSHPPRFAPGTSWSYSNTGYVVLGLVIEAVTGRPASSEVTRRVIWPLGLWRTSFPTSDAEIAGAHAHGYLTGFPGPDGQPTTKDVTVFGPSLFWTAGGIISTADDVARFHRALLAGRLLAPAQMVQLTNAVHLNDQFEYGAGVEHVRTACGWAWGHDGEVPGFRTLSLTSEDGSRQVVLALTATDLATLLAPLTGQAAAGPILQDLARAQTAALCD
jgi:D-alanyl-D-alanine carboxypeptidase